MAGPIAQTYFSYSARVHLPIQTKKRASEHLSVEFVPAEFAADSLTWQAVRDDIVALSRRVYAGKVRGPAGVFCDS